MLLCGFEKFDTFFVRIDILERLFIQILNSNSKEEEKMIKMVPEMINLLGCSRENFKKLVGMMNYKIFEINSELFFKYNPPKKNKKIILKKPNKESPFMVLKNLNLN